jgi:hypothetical protein
MSRNLTRLNVSLTLATDKFGKGLKAAEKGLTGLASGIGSITKRILSPLNLIGVTLSTGAFALGISKAMRGIDNLAKTADSLQVTTQALAGLQHAAELTGVGAEQLNRAMARSQRVLGEAAMGVGGAVKWIEQLGLKVADLQAMSPDERFKAYAKAIQGMATQSERAAASAALFGDRQGAMLPMLMEGRVGLEAAAKEAEALGIALNRVDAAKVEAANDAITRIKAAATGLFQSITVRLAPFIDYFAQSMADAAISVGGVGTAIDNVVDFAVKGVSFIIDAWQGLGLLWAWAQKAFYGLAKGIMSGIQMVVKGVTWWADKFSQAWELIKIGFKSVIATVELGWAVLRKGVVAAVTFIGNQVRDILFMASDAMRRIKGMMDEADRLYAAAVNIGIAANNSYLASTESARDATDAVMDLAAQASQATDNLFGHTELRGSEFVENLTAEFAKLQVAAQDSIFDKLAEGRMAERFEATVANIQLESQLRAEQKAAGLQAEITHQAAITDVLAESAEHQQDILTAAWAKGQADRLKFSDSHWTQQTKTAIAQIEQITRGVAQNNKAMFRINQIAGAANAAINTAEGVTKALSAYPPPLSFAMAGLQAAAGAVQIAAIKSQSFGGGASAPSVAGSGGGVPSQTGPNEGVGPGVGRAGMPSAQPARIVIDKSVAVDPVRLAEAVNQAGRDGFVFDGIDLQ